MDDNYALDLVGTFLLSLPKADAISSLINTKGHEASYSAACDSGDWIPQATWMDGVQIDGASVQSKSRPLSLFGD